MPTLTEATRNTAIELSECGFKQAGTQARILIQAAAKMTAEQLVINMYQEITPLIQKRLESFLNRRKRREPIQYITQEVHFYKRKFFVCKGVFIPRPETELLIEHVLTFVKSHCLNIPIRIADVFTGSGVIAVTLAKELPDATVFASDISTCAVQVTKQNARIHNANVQVIQCSQLQGIRGHYNIITANPPYIPSCNIPSLAEEISYEPILALDGGKRGLDQIETLLKDLPNKLSAGLCICEIDSSHADEVKSIAKKHLPKSVSISTIQDIYGAHRFLHISLKETTVS